MDETTFSVPELTAAVRALVRAGFPDELWVEGEIGSISRTAAGHVFLDLVEPGPVGSPPVARVPVVLWDDARRQVNATLREHGAVRMTEGVRIRIRGQLDVYPRGGRLQVRMTAIDPEFTIGRLAVDRERLLRALAADGLLERNAGRPLPPVPTRVGLVTRVGSAAHADVLGELRSSGLGLQVLEADTAVQGVGAERRVAAALRALEAAGAEVVLVARGGGARTDLVAFDAELVARTVADLSVPVWTGVGHEVDDTVVDVVAHRSFKTPTACAAGLVAQVRQALARLDGLAEDLLRTGPAALARAEHRLDGLADRTARTGTASLARADAELHRRTGGVAALAQRQLRSAGRRLDSLGDELARRPGRALAAAAARLDVAEARVSGADPQRALARGWSITRTSDGAVVRDPAAVASGDLLVTTVAAGELRSTVVAERAPAGEEGGGGG